jgi:lysophospholipase L1-like esterase
VLLITLMGVGALVYVAFLRGPTHGPQDFLANGPRAGTRYIVVAAGASMTQGSLGADWVGLLRTTRGSDGYEFVNAGRNGDTSAGLRERLDDEVIACRPVAVTVLIGTNDVLDAVPVDVYRSNVDAIVGRLTAAEIPAAVLSLPPAGEDLGSPRNERVTAYNDVLADVAEAHDATYLPLHERLVTLLDEGDRDSAAPYGFSFPLALGTAFEHYVLRRSWDDVAASNGLTIHTDHLHLSDRAGQVVAELVDAWLTSQLP